MINRDSLVDSISMECAYLHKMIELLKENKVTDNEKTVLVNYIDRRTEWLLGYEEDKVKELLDEMEQAVKEYKKVENKQPDDEEYIQDTSSLTD